MTLTVFRRLGLGVLVAVVVCGFDAPAQAIDAYRAPAVQPRFAQAVQPRYAPPVRPRYAQPVQPRYAQPVRPRYAPAVQQRPNARLIMDRSGQLRVVRDRPQRPAYYGPARAAPSRGYNGCAPNCGFDYSQGRAAPTIYNPTHNYSPYGN